jgi:transcription elongation regulator 1
MGFSSLLPLSNPPQIRKDFFELLRESSDIDRHSHWMDIKKKIDKDPRYSAISDSVLREDYFYDYIKILKDERKKKKAKKSDKKEKKKKSKDKDRSSKDASETAADENGDNKAKSETADDKKNEGDAEKSSPMEIDDGKSDDGTDSEKDEEDGEHSGTDSETERQRKDRDRQARAEASIKQREQEVKQTLAENLRERDKERQHHKRDEAVRHFIALLNDLVRNSDYTWKEVKKQLKKDHRWELVDTLEREEKEKLFNDHIGQLTKKKRDKFREMLEEIAALELTSSWKDIKRQVRDDPRFLKFGPSDRVSGFDRKSHGIPLNLEPFSAKRNSASTFATKPTQPSLTSKNSCRSASSSPTRASISTWKTAIT